MIVTAVEDPGQNLEALVDPLLAVVTYFCLVADAMVELHSMKIVVATTAVGGKVDLFLTDECQNEIRVLFPNFTLE